MPDEIINVGGIRMYKQDVANVKKATANDKNNEVIFKNGLSVSFSKSQPDNAFIMAGEKDNVSVFSNLHDVNIKGSQHSDHISLTHCMGCEVNVANDYITEDVVSMSQHDKMANKVILGHNDTVQER